MGLQMNVSKCEVIAHPNFSTTDAMLQSFTRVDVCDAFLLGAPLFHGSELDKSWNGCCCDLARAAERPRDIGCQDALILLRSSFSAPKVLHLLRCARSVSHAALETFDSLLRDCIQTFSGCRPAFQLKMVAWGEMCLRSQFPPIWHQRQAHCPCRWTFSLAVPAQMILTCSK